MSRIGLYLILVTFMISAGFQQKPSPVHVFTKNQIHGLFLTAKALKTSNDLVTLIITIKNIDEKAMSQMTYKLECTGLNGKVLLDTIINIPEVNKEQEAIPEYFYSQSEIDGEIIQIANAFYWEDKLKNQFKINAKSKYISTVLLTKKNVTGIRIKPIWVTFGSKSYCAPGY